jgi:hypothetical protein
MQDSTPERTRPRRGLRFAAGALLLGWLLGCGNDDPTGLGSDLRTAPDTLYVVELDSVAADTVYAQPGWLDQAPLGQVGSRFPYTAHVLYAFQIPTRVVQAPDTFQLDSLTLVLRADSLTEAPFAGSMRLGLLEVAPAARGWRADSLMDELPALEPDELAPDTVLAGSALANRSLRLGFTLRLDRVADYRAVRDTGGTLEVNVALRFEGFDTSGRGFLELPFRDAAGSETAQLIGFSDAQPAGAIATVVPAKRRALVDFDATYSPGTKLAVSDGYRLHSYLRFGPLRGPGRLPDSALVHLAELVLTQVDSLDGTGFGLGPRLGAIVPRDTDSLYTLNENRRSLAFSSELAALPRSQVTIPITPYAFDIQEGTVPDRGLILRLSNEGTKARHFEFYGGAAADSLRPRLRIIYSLPAPFEGGER